MTTTTITYGGEKKAIINLRNKSVIPDDVLVPLVTQAAEFVECWGEEVDLYFSSGKKLWGYAQKTNYSRVIVPISKTKGISFLWSITNSRVFARKIYSVLAHELFHNADYQKGTFEKYERYSNHDNRACEIKADAVANEALINLPEGALDQLIDTINKLKKGTLDVVVPYKAPVVERIPPAIPKYELKVASSKYIQDK